LGVRIPRGAQSTRSEAIKQEKLIGRYLAVSVLDSRRRFRDRNLTGK
jgi:hypothetical protein